uniref:Aldose 1-epimerase n=1 Tax=Opuntia streptacantha TaxID=393608 RepID=A0A7C8ZL69_OPUST
MTGSSVEKKRRFSEEMGVNRNQMGPGSAGSGTARHSNSDSVQTSRASRFNSNRELTQVELCNILMFKARNEISKKISEWGSVTTVANAAQKEKVMEQALGKDKTINIEVNGDSHDQQSGRRSDTSNADKILQNVTDSTAAKEMLDRLSIPVPDPDFYDFDKDRTERAFGENQVWALYDNDDGMPRYYAMIHSVISQDPFRVRISWLSSKTNADLGPLNWAASGFSKTCGDFRGGRHETYDSLNCFSHKVKWTKGTRGVIRIFPRKGDVWALYRNWSPDWDEFTSDKVICKYEMVEVLEDYDEQLGVVVIPLVKVAGFKAVFHRHLNPKQARRIPKEEILRFSYQIPSHLISGHEAPNAPKGCRELDPAALPLEFLQVIADVKDKDIAKNQTFQQGEVTNNGMKELNHKDTALNTEKTK